MTRLSDMLVYLRNRSGLSQQELADALKVSRSAIGMYETGKREPDLETLEAFADYYNIDMNTLTGNQPVSPQQNTTLPSNAIPYIRGRRFPIVGDIPAGVPILAEENIQGYEYADVPEGEDYFFLRVKGDSMINAGITNGSLVLIKMQSCADNGQIVACRINGDEATLKRFKQQGDMVILMPENSNYEPIIVSCQDFENGYASIIGAAVKVVRDLL